MFDMPEAEVSEIVEDFFEDCPTHGNYKPVWRVSVTRKILALLSKSKQEYMRSYDPNEDYGDDPSEPQYSRQKVTS